MAGTTVAERPTKVVKKAKKKERNISAEMKKIQTIFAKYIALMRLKAEHLRDLNSGNLDKKQKEQTLAMIRNTILKQQRIIKKENTGLGGVTKDIEKLNEEIQEYIDNHMDVNDAIRFIRRQDKVFDERIKSVKKPLKGIEKKAMDEQKTINRIKGLLKTERKELRAVRKSKGKNKEDMEEFMQTCRIEWRASRKFMSSLTEYLNIERELDHILLR